MKLLVLLAAFLVTGCSVEVAHETENKSQTESLSTFDKSKTAVAMSILKVPESLPESTDSQESATSQTTVKVVVPESSPRVLIPLPPAPCCPEPTIQLEGDGNTVILGDVHHHEHVHIHQTPKLHPVRLKVRVVLGDRISERERRRRMVQKRISKAFPHYGN